MTTITTPRLSLTRFVTALAAKHQDGGFPHQQADSGGGNAENRRSMERMTQRMGELLVMHRVGSWRPPALPSAGTIWTKR